LTGLLALQLPLVMTSDFKPEVAEKIISACFIHVFAGAGQSSPQGLKPGGFEACLRHGSSHALLQDSALCGSSDSAESPTAFIAALGTTE
jgi:hypothetical protein